MSYGSQYNVPWYEFQNHQQSADFHESLEVQNAHQNSMAPFNPIAREDGGILNLVSYPQPRSYLNPDGFQESVSPSFPYKSIGTVTNLNIDCGIIDNEVFFCRDVFEGSELKLGDGVIFEAFYSKSGQFGWQAARVQRSMQIQPVRSSNSGSYNIMESQNEYQYCEMRPNLAPIIDTYDCDRELLHSANDTDEYERKRSRNRNRKNEDRPRYRDEEEHESKRKRQYYGRNDKDQELYECKEKRQRRDPSRMRGVYLESRVSDESGGLASRYSAGNEYYISSNISKTMDGQDISQHYPTIHIPYNFLRANIKWWDTFTSDNLVSLKRPCHFHIMPETVKSPIEKNPNLFEPSDANSSYSAKVMLMSLPPIHEINKKSFENDNALQPSSLINFLVGVKGRTGSMPIGGSWSPSLDGENPDEDPSVLIRTAIRTCKARTGIDLSNCTRWHPFMEVRYRNVRDTDENLAAIENVVVIYLPNVHSCMPKAEEWRRLKKVYENAANDIIIRCKQPTHYSQLHLKSMTLEEIRNELLARKLPDKGMHNIAMARLAKALNTERTKDLKNYNGNSNYNNKSSSNSKELSEKETIDLIRCHTLPTSPHIIVHPNRLVKDEKFHYAVVPLSSLESNKSGFEISLFAKFFNEMLTRYFTSDAYKERANKYKEIKAEKMETQSIRNGSGRSNVTEYRKLTPSTVTTNSSHSKANNPASRITSHNSSSQVAQQVALGCGGKETANNISSSLNTTPARQVAKRQKSLARLAFRKRRAADKVHARLSAKPADTLSAEEMSSLEWAKSVLAGPCWQRSEEEETKQQDQQPASKQLKLHKPIDKSHIEVTKDDILMAVIDRGNTNYAITPSNWVVVRRQLEGVLGKVLRDNPGDYPRCKEAGWYRGRVKLMACADERSIMLLKLAIDRLQGLWEGARLDVVPSKEIPRWPRALARVPDTPSDKDEILQLLRLGNPEVPTNDWQVTKVSEPSGCFRHISVLINQESLPLIKERKGKMYYGFGTIHLKIYRGDDKGHLIQKAGYPEHHDTMLVETGDVKPKLEKQFFGN